MFEYDKTLVVGFVWGHPLQDEMKYWISQKFKSENTRAVNIEPYAICRNLAIRDAVLPRLSNYKYVLFVDNDVIPRPATDLIFSDKALEYDVVCAKCFMPGQHAWKGTRSFHQALWWAKSEVFTKVKPPWFKFIFTEDYCHIENCDCYYFAKKCEENGFRVRNIGSVGHIAYNSWRKQHVL